MSDFNRILRQKQATPYHKSTAGNGTQQIATGAAYLKGILIGETDGLNDPTITIYNGTANTDHEVVPTTTYDASALGLNGFMPAFDIPCKGGIFYEITCGGACEVVIYYSQYRA